MSSPQETVLALPAKTVPALLEQLQYLRQQAAGGKKVVMPLTTFHLRSGRDLTGWLVQYDSRADALLIQLQDRQPVFNLSYCSPREVEAITLMDAFPVADQLQF